MAESTFGTSQSSLSSRVSCSVAESPSGLATIGVAIKRPRLDFTPVAVLPKSLASSIRLYLSRPRFAPVSIVAASPVQSSSVSTVAASPVQSSFVAAPANSVSSVPASPVALVLPPPLPPPLPRFPSSVLTSYLFVCSRGFLRLDCCSRLVVHFFWPRFVVHTIVTLGLDCFVCFWCRFVLVTFWWRTYFYIG